MEASRQFVVFRDIETPDQVVCVDLEDVDGWWSGWWTRPLRHGQQIEQPEIRCGIVHLRSGVALCVKELSDEISHKVTQVLALPSGGG